MLPFTSSQDENANRLNEQKVIKSDLPTYKPSHYSNLALVRVPDQSAMTVAIPSLFTNSIRFSSGNNKPNSQTAKNESNKFFKTTETDSLVVEAVSDRQRLEQGIVRLFTHGHLSSEEVRNMHALVRNILNSKAGIFLHENYNTQILPKGLTQLRNAYLLDEQQNSERFLNHLARIWNKFFTSILPTIDCILFRMQTKCNLSIRQISLRTFRNELLLTLPIESKYKIIRETTYIIKINAIENMQQQKKPFPNQIKHMLLTLNSVIDTFPPQKAKLRLEAITAQVVSPFLGYRGLYVDHENEPSTPSSEPIMYAHRKSVDVVNRRLSRPLSVQPKQIKTLNELFLSIVRKNSQKHNF